MEELGKVSGNDAIVKPVLCLATSVGAVFMALLALWA